jgi:hypothetical protein
MASKFAGNVTFEEVVRAAGIEMDPKGLYFAKPYRNCQSQAAFNGAVSYAFQAKDKEIMRLTEELKNAYDRHSREAAKTAVLCEEKAELTKTCFRRGLEALPEIAPVTRDRLLNVNGG